MERRAKTPGLSAGCCRGEWSGGSGVCGPPEADEKEDESEALDCGPPLAPEVLGEAGS